MPYYFQRASTKLYSNGLKIAFVIFITTNIILFYFLHERDRLECGNHGSCRHYKKRKSFPAEKRGQSLYFNVLSKYFTHVNDEWRLIVSNTTSVTISPDLNCSALQNMTDFKFVAFGWTKITFKALLNNQTISVKVVNINGHDIASCLLEKDRHLFDCYLTAASKLVHEIALLRNLSHDNIIKVLGYCIPDDPDMKSPVHTVAVFEEYGEPIDVIKLLQLSWEDRLRISLGLSRLLKHLASFQEPISLNDFRRQQFVVINGELKLIDVDDIGLHEPLCNNTICCSSEVLNEKKSICVPCIANVCHGFNEKINILRTGGYFIKHILPYGAPLKLYSWAQKITTAFEMAVWNTSDILREMENLTTAYKIGLYRSVDKSDLLSGYKVYSQKDVSSDFDYRCQLTVTSYGCMTSVVDSEEAAEICSLDPICKAFILTNVTTWLGRRMAQFKKGVGKLRSNNGTILFIKL